VSSVRVPSVCVRSSVVAVSPSSPQWWSLRCSRLSRAFYKVRKQGGHVVAGGATLKYNTARQCISLAAASAAPAARVPYALDNERLAAWVTAPPPEKEVLRVVSWNVAGMRGMLNNKDKASEFSALIRRTKPHHLLLQETKLQHTNVEEVSKKLNNLRLYEDGSDDTTTVGDVLKHRVWSCSRARKGYSGVAILSTEPHTWKSASVAADHNEEISALVEEGRVLTVRDKSGWVVCNAYVPNSGVGLKTIRRRIDAWEPALCSHLERSAAGAFVGEVATTSSSSLENETSDVHPYDVEMAGALSTPVAQDAESTAPRGVVYAGDLNVAMQPQDLWGNHHKNRKLAGYTDEERECAAKLLQDVQLHDAFRVVHGEDVKAFTYWDYRSKARLENRGWRIDYTLVTDADAVLDSFVLDDVQGSDHCPVLVVLSTA